MDPDPPRHRALRNGRERRAVALPRWRLRGRPGVAPIAVSVIVTVSIAFLAACAGFPSPNAARGSTNAGGSSSSRSASSKLIAFTRCMRSHGVPNFPDPRGGGFPKATIAQIAASNSRYGAATGDCAHLLPPGNSGLTAAQAQEIEKDELKFVRCMRSHGVRNWPDPTLTRGRLVFDPQAAGINPTSPQISSRMKGCDRVFPASVGVPPGAGYNPGYGP